MKSPKKDLVQIIKDNPGCIAIVDNDGWRLQRKPTSENPHNEDAGYSEASDVWERDNTLATDRDDFIWPDGYGKFASCCYGGDVLEALAVIVGIKVESV